MTSLTQKQQRKTLSAKKGPTKGLRNVLATPHENYWPLLKNGADLENLLKRLLPVLKRTEQKVPWGQLRKMNKEERLVAKKAAQIQSNAEYDAEAAKFIVFGINAVTRLLEKDNTSVILLEAGVDPSLLVKHILAMAHNKSIPVVLVSFLKKSTLETIGYACAAISLKKEAESADNYFYDLYKKVSELSVQLPKPKTPVSLFQNDSVIEDDENQSSVENMEQDVVEPVTVSTDVYLYRTSKTERVFEPNHSSRSKPNVENKWTDFIALSDEKCDVVDVKTKVPLRFFASLVSDKDEQDDYGIQHHKRKKESSDEPSAKVSYKPLKVKRLQGNELRKKATKKPQVKKKKQFFL